MPSHVQVLRSTSGLRQPGTVARFHPDLPSELKPSYGTGPVCLGTCLQPQLTYEVASLGARRDLDETRGRDFPSTLLAYWPQAPSDIVDYLTLDTQAPLVYLGIIIARCWLIVGFVSNRHSFTWVRSTKLGVCFSLVAIPCRAQTDHSI